MTVENFVKQTGAGFPILFDSDNKAVRDYGIVPMPTTFLWTKRQNRLHPSGRVES